MDAQNSEGQSEYLTRKEAAALLRVTPNLISRMYHENKLKAARIGGIFRFHRDDIDAMRTTKPPRRGR